MNIKKKLGKEIIFFDGAMGTMLQKNGLILDAKSSLYNFTHADLIHQIHKEYLEAGAMVITTNTFLANSFNLENTGYSVEDVIKKATAIAKEAIKQTGKEANVALSIGSTGKCIADLEDADKEKLYRLFQEQVIAGEKAGCDVILFETFMDIGELEVAVLAAKHNTTLPIFCTMTFESNGKTYFGTTLEQMVATLQKIGVDAIGMNCSVGPKALRPLVTKIKGMTQLPIIIQPNAGLPTLQNGKMVYKLSAQEFAIYMNEYAELGISILGGCCGTTPEMIKRVIELIKSNRNLY